MAGRQVRQPLVAPHRQAVAERRRERDAEALDALERVAWGVLEQPGYEVSPSGRVVIDPEGSPLLDTGRQLDTIGVLLRIQTRRAKLFGLDTPARASVSVSLEAAIAAVERLEREADRTDAARAWPGLA